MREHGQVPDADRLLLHLETCLGPLDESGGASETPLREVGGRVRDRVPRFAEGSLLRDVRTLAPRPERPVEFVRLLPITDDEAKYAREYGWEQAAAAMANSGIDLRDFFRPSTV